MNIINLQSLSFVDFQFISQHYSFIFFLAVITLALAVMLKSVKAFITQFALLISLAFLNESMPLAIPILVSIIQLLFSGFVIYRYKKAVDRNYRLILEKTRQIPRELTKNDPGTKHSFL